jgi:transposase-like protein
MKYKSDDYKLSAVLYYLNNDVTMDDVCSIFGCSSSSLSRWVDKYNTSGHIKNLTN